MEFISWIIIGLIAGAIAGYLVPGRTPGGLIGTVVVGILGGILGGWIWGLLGLGDDTSFIGSIIVAVVGAFIILQVMRKATN
jgi:uncharacterized membrane protein YeaQ/YmgE (transglycosylase-associated protein family)